MIIDTQRGEEMEYIPQKRDEIIRSGSKLYRTVFKEEKRNQIKEHNGEDMVGFPYIMQNAGNSIDLQLIRAGNHNDNEGVI